MKTRWTLHEIRLGEMKNSIQYLKGRNYWGDIGVDGRIILKSILQK
jgi:hypothetical protein